MTREEALKIIKNGRITAGIIRANDEETTKYNLENIEALNMVVEALEQEPKTGHWFIDERPESDRETICSNCEQPIFKYHKLDFDYRPRYCPNCGARMVEPQESEDKE